jgi:hypothetical protein
MIFSANKTMGRILLAMGALAALISLQAGAQSADRYGCAEGAGAGCRAAETPAGKAALAANYTVTGGIQTGAIRQPTLLPFAEQQQQALQDAFITDGDLAQLADGLGTTLGAGVPGACALSR